MSNFTKFVSTDRQGHFQLGHYDHITSTISISQDTTVAPKITQLTSPDSKVGYYDLRETEEVKKLITTVVSFSSNDPVLDAKKAQQVFLLVKHHSASTYGPGTL